MPALRAAVGCLWWRPAACLRERAVMAGLGAAIAGAWMALVAGFGGMRAGAGSLAFSPRLPGGIAALTFRLRYRGRKLCVAVKPERATYELLDGHPLEITHHGKEFKLGKKPVEQDIPPVTTGPPPEEPPRTAPHRRPP